MSVKNGRYPSAPYFATTKHGGANEKPAYEGKFEVLKYNTSVYYGFKIGFLMTYYNRRWKMKNISFSYICCLHI